MTDAKLQLILNHIWQVWFKETDIGADGNVRGSAQLYVKARKAIEARKRLDI